MFRFETQPCCTCHNDVSCCMNDFGKCSTFTCQRSADTLDKTYDRSCIRVCTMRLYWCFHETILRIQIPKKVINHNMPKMTASNFFLPKVMNCLVLWTLLPWCLYRQCRTFWNSVRVCMRWILVCYAWPSWVFGFSQFWYWGYIKTKCMLVPSSICN